MVDVLQAGCRVMVPGQKKTGMLCDSVREKQNKFLTYVLWLRLVPGAVPYLLPIGKVQLSGMDLPWVFMPFSPCLLSSQCKVSWNSRRRHLAKTGELEQSLPLLFFTCFGVVVIPEGLSGFSLCTLTNWALLLTQFHKNAADALLGQEAAAEICWFSTGFPHCAGVGWHVRSNYVLLSVWNLRQTHCKHGATGQLS